MSKNQDPRVITGQRRLEASLQLDGQATVVYAQTGEKFQVQAGGELVPLGALGGEQGKTGAPADSEPTRPAPSRRERRAGPGAQAKGNGTKWFHHFLK